MHVSLKHVQVAMVLFIPLMHSLASCLSALSKILFPLVDLILLFNLKLLGVIL